MQQEELLRRAFQLTRRNPALWLLALLAGEGAGGGSFSSSGGSFSQPGHPVDTTIAAGQLVAAGQWLVANGTELLIAAAGALSVALVVSCLATGALYRAQVTLDSGSPFGPAAAWGAARESFWNLLGWRFLTLLALLAPCLLLSLLTLGMYIAGGASALVIALLIDSSFLVFLGLLSLLAWPVLTLTDRSIVLDRLRPVAALRNVLGLIGRRAGQVLITTAIAIGLGIALGIVFSLVDTIISVPFASSLSDAVQSFDLRRIESVGLEFLALLLPASLLLGAVAGSFYSAYWTLSFRTLQRNTITAGPPEGTP